MRRALAAAITAAFFLAVPAKAQEWPQRQVSVVVPFAAGGSTDLIARIIAQHMQAKFGVPFVVENKAGAGGSIGTGMVAKAPNDGYTLLVGTVSSNAINAFLYSKLPFDVARDLQPVSLLARLPNLLFVHPKTSGQDGGGADRLSQGERRQGELRFVRQRHVLAFVLGDVPDDERDQDDARAVPQHQRGDEQYPRRQYRAGDRQHDDGLAARPDRPSPRDRRYDPATQRNRA